MLFGELISVRSKEMVIADIHKSGCVQTVSRFEKQFRLKGYRMFICELINGTVKGNAFLNFFGVVKFLFSFYKITDEIANQNLRIIKRKICMGEVIQAKIFFRILNYFPEQR